MSGRDVEREEVTARRVFRRAVSNRFFPDGGPQFLFSMISRGGRVSVELGPRWVPLRM